MIEIGTPHHSYGSRKWQRLRDGTFITFITPKDYQWHNIASGILLGVALALLITGYALKEKETHNSAPASPADQ